MINKTPQPGIELEVKRRPNSFRFSFTVDDAVFIFFYFGKMSEI